MSSLLWISLAILIALIATLIVVVHFARRSARRYAPAADTPSSRHRALWGYAGRDASLYRRFSSRHAAPDARIATTGYAPGKRDAHQDVPGSR